MDGERTPNEDRSTTGSRCYQIGVPVFVKSVEDQTRWEKEEGGDPGVVEKEELVGQTNLVQSKETLEIVAWEEEGKKEE